MISENVKTVCLTILICILFPIILCSCQESEVVKLCDYKNIDVAKEDYEVSDEDLSFAIKMSLMEKGVTEIKETNKETIEQGDVVNLTISQNGKEPDTKTIAVGESEISDAFDSFLLGKKSRKSYSFESEGLTYKIQINGIYTYAKKISDSIAKKYYNAESAAEAQEQIKSDIEEHRKFEYAYEKLLSESMIKTDYSEKADYISIVINQAQKEAEKNRMSLEEYIQENFDCTTEEYRKSEEDFYDEFMILKTLAAKEKISVSDDEFEKVLLSLAESDDIDTDTVLHIYGKEQIYYSIYMEKIYYVLLKYVN